MPDKKEEPKPRIRRVNLLIHVSEGTDPDKIIFTVEKIIKNLEEKGITSKYIKSSYGVTHGVSVDSDGKGEE